MDRVEEHFGTGIDYLTWRWYQTLLNRTAPSVFETGPSREISELSFLSFFLNRKNKPPQPGPGPRVSNHYLIPSIDHFQGTHRGEPAKLNRTSSLLLICHPDTAVSRNTDR